MAVVRPRTHFLVSLIAFFIDAVKREVFVDYGGGSVTGSSAAEGTGATGGTAPAFTGTAPTRAVGSADIASGTGYATAGQVVTTTETTFTATLNQYAGCWLLAATKAPCLIVSHPAATAEALALTVQGAPPATTAEGFRILGAPTPVGAVASHTHTGPSHTHGAGTFAAGPVTAPIHFDRAEYAITAANASSLETSRTLLGAVVTAYLTHAADALAHLAADATNVPAETLQELLAALPTDTLGGMQTLANEFKALYNAHRAEAGVHATNDAGHAIAAADATDQSSLNTLLNELKADLNLHMADGLATPSWRAVDA
jgi:hypothetical protein